MMSRNLIQSTFILGSVFSNYINRNPAEDRTSITIHGVLVHAIIGESTIYKLIFYA